MAVSQIYNMSATACHDILHMWPWHSLLQTHLFHELCGKNVQMYQLHHQDLMTYAAFSYAAKMTHYQIMAVSTAHTRHRLIKQKFVDNLWSDVCQQNDKIRWKQFKCRV